MEAEEVSQTGNGAQETVGVCGRRRVFGAIERGEEARRGPAYKAEERISTGCEDRMANPSTNKKKSL